MNLVAFIEVIKENAATLDETYAQIQERLKCGKKHRRVSSENIHKNMRARSRPTGYKKWRETAEKEITLTSPSNAHVVKLRT